MFCSRPVIVYKRGSQQPQLTAGLLDPFATSIVLRTPQPDGTRLARTYPRVFLVHGDGQSFAKPGDSGSAVVDADDCVVGMLVGVYVEGGVQSSIRTFNAHVDAVAIRALIPKTVGLRLYADAVALSADVARYREFWRVMESAFGLQDDKLVAALAAYGPAQELGFDAAELRELLILQGQASHAATSGGLEEILRVGEQTRRRGDRLKCLVERVILTKRSWGVRSGGVDELIPAASWVGPGGQIVIRRAQP